MAHDRELGVMAFTGYMKYQEELIRAEPRRAMMVSGNGSKPVPFHYLCPFRPENVQDYVDLLTRIAGWPGIREIHLNDEASLGFEDGRIGCYCDHCSETFEHIFGSPPPLMNDYGDPAWWDWVNHRMESWVNLHAVLRKRIKSVNPEVAVGIQHSPVNAGLGINPWKSGIDPGLESKNMDVMATDPYHHNHSGKFPFRPHGRILTEVTRVLLGSNPSGRTNVYTQAFAPPGTSIELGSQDGLLEGTVPHALGAETITPYAYELMKILPGFFNGLKLTRRFIPYFEATLPYSFATVIYPSQTEVFGHPGDDWGRTSLMPWAELMNRTGLPWRWLWDRHIEESPGRISGPIILPGVHCLTWRQIEVLEGIAAGGSGLLWCGTTPHGPWSRRGRCPPPSRVEEGPFRLELSGGDSLAKEIHEPVMLASRETGPGIPGRALGSLDGAVGLVLNEDSGKRAWISGRPVHSYVRPGDHGSVRTPTGGVDLLRNLLGWLSPTEPLFEIRPFPPPNDYGRLRPWDRRDLPTMEMFPLMGEDISLAIVLNYTHLPYRCDLVIRSPDGSGPRRIYDPWNGMDLDNRARIVGDEVILDLKSSAARDLYAVAVNWG